MAVERPAGIEYGMCHCRCGEPAPIAKYTMHSRGWVKGEPKRFIQGHIFKTPELRAIVSALRTEETGPANHNWTAGEWYNTQKQCQYVLHNGGHVQQHRLAASKMLGRPLASNELVIPRDGNRLNTDHGNLEVISRSDYARRLIQNRKRNGEDT